LAVVFVLGWASTLPLRSQLADLRAQLDQLRAENEDLSMQMSKARELSDQIAELRRQNEGLRHDLDSGSPFAAVLKDGEGRVTVDRQGNVNGIEALARDDQQDVRTALIREQVKIPEEVKGLAGPPGKLMSLEPTAQYGLIAPLGEVIQSDRPTCRWRPIDRAGSYVVTVFAPHFKIVATSEPTTATEWTVPNPLERGKVYSWQVRAVVDGKEVVIPPPQAFEAKFKVLPGDGLEQIERVRRANPKSHLALGVIYAKLGMLDESERELQALLSANPESPTARKLLGSVASLRKSYARERPR
jgi:hypothetical protein